MNALETIAVIAAVAYLIGRQLAGEKLAGKRLVLLPAVLTVIGAARLAPQWHHLGASDVTLIGLGAAVATGVGLLQGRAVRLEQRDGVLWGQMPRRSLWLWLGLVASHLVVAVLASATGAHVAAGTAPLLLTLGVNRLAQSAVVLVRAWHAGIALAPENDGSTFLVGIITPGRSADPAGRPHMADTRPNATPASGSIPRTDSATVPAMTFGWGRETILASSATRGRSRGAARRNRRSR